MVDMRKHGLFRRDILLAAPGLLLAGHYSPAWADDGQKVVLGALRFTSSGPVFLALDRGYFAAEGLSVEIAFFQDAPTVAAAAASGDVTFGITALTAALFNLAAAGRLKIIAGQAQEKKGYSGNLILVNQKAFAAGYDSLTKLFGQPFGLTQLGSPSHYQVGQLADAGGVAVKDLDIRTFQTLPNLVAALKSGGVSWAIIAPPIATDLVDAGAVVAIGRYSDHGSYQFGGVYAATALLESDPDLARRFLRSYKKGVSDYSRIVTDPASSEAKAAAAVVGHYVYADLSPEKAAGKVLASAFYVDASGQLDIADISRQIAWYAANGMVKTAPEVDSILRLDLLQ